MNQSKKERKKEDMNQKEKKERNEEWLNQLKIEGTTKSKEERRKRRNQLKKEYNK